MRPHPCCSRLLSVRGLLIVRCGVNLDDLATSALVLLRPGPDGWSAEDWQIFFGERAGIAEFDGGLPRPEAEARGFACCVVEGWNRTFVRSPSGCCLRCGGGRSCRNRRR
jgi:hypothetical protein